MTQVIQQTGENTVLFGEWTITDEYLKGAIVIKDGDLWAANNDIPANTAFAEGTTGATWECVLKTMKTSAVNPQIRICEETFTALGRLHVWGNRVFTAGHSTVSNANSFYGQGQPDNLGNSTELYCLDGAPDNWVKFTDTFSNFYGLGDDGILRVAGRNGNGALGLGETAPSSYQIINQTHPSLYGPGIQVLDFWATNFINNTNTRTSSCWVQVDDNGVLRLYSFGYNSTGSMGNGTASTEQFVPYEHVMMRGKRVKKIVNNVLSGGSLSLLLTENGEVWGTGANPNGMLANGSLDNSLVLTQCKYNAGTYVTDAADIDLTFRWGSYAFTYVLTASGTVYAAGNNADNGLGIGDLTSTLVGDAKYFLQVRSGPTAPLTNIVKIKATDFGLAALDNIGQVWMTGKNNDGMWGNGQSAYANGQTWATVKQGGIKNMWFSKGNRGGYCASYWLTTDNRFLASGGNHYYQLGIATPVAQQVTNNTTAVPVALPRGEYPVQVRWIGSSQYDSGTDTTPMIGGGILMVSNTNKLYTWGRPWAQVSGLKGLAREDSLRYPHCINDFYDKRYL